MSPEILRRPRRDYTRAPFRYAVQLGYEQQSALNLIPPVASERDCSTRKNASKICSFIP
jgi:hypothetical protein